MKALCSVGERKLGRWVREVAIVICVGAYAEGVEAMELGEDQFPFGNR